MHPRIRVSLVGIVLFAFGPSALAASRDGVPEGLSSSDWSGIRAAYEANRHVAFDVEGGYQARSPGQQWQMCFDGRGFLTTPDSGGWSWGLELVSYGRDGAEKVVSGVAPAIGELVAPAISRCAGVAPVINRCGQRVEYDWDETLTEWYVNDGRGLEHGYTVHQRPDELSYVLGSPRDEKSPDRKGGVRSRMRRSSHSQGDRSLTLDIASQRRGQAVAALNGEPPLHFTLAIRGDLRARISAGGRDVIFESASGAAVVNYSGLTVFDARGVNQPARFVEALLPQGSGLKPQASGLKSQAFSIVVDDTNATYPLTIDPIAQQACLKASNTEAGDSFGHSVAVSGDTVVVGAVGEDSSATGVVGNPADNSAADSGAAYVFVRSGATWSQQAYLKASNTGGDDRFGDSLAVSGDMVVVGAWKEDSSATGVNGDEGDNGAVNAGAAYVFVRSGTTWSQQAYLKASNTGANDNFGHSVSVSGDTVVVGADDEDSSATGANGDEADNSAHESGAAYVFIRSGTTWSQQAYLKASNTDGGDQFGHSASVSGDTLVVGAYLEGSNATGVNGNQADNSASFAGAAYVFVRSGTTWSQQAYLKPSNTDAGDLFGHSVPVSGDTVVVGAPGEDSSTTGMNGNQADNSAFAAGAAYVFVRSGTTWTQQAYLKASNTGVDDRFGDSLAVSGDTVVVGAWKEDSSTTGVNGNQADNSALEAGAAYVFVRNGTTWSQQAYLKPSNTGADDLFGWSVTVSGDTVVVGAWQEDSSATGVNGDQADNSAGGSGAAYILVTCPTFIADLNCDCAVNNADLDPFVLALLDPAGYATAYPGCNILNGDMQPDGSVNGDDAQAFVDLLIP